MAVFPAALEGLSLFPSGKLGFYHRKKEKARKKTKKLQKRAKNLTKETVSPSWEAFGRFSSSPPVRPDLSGSGRTQEGN